MRRRTEADNRARTDERGLRAISGRPGARAQSWPATAVFEPGERHRAEAVWPAPARIGYRDPAIPLLIVTAAIPIVSREARQAWLDEALDEAGALSELLRPYPAEEMEAFAVSTAINNPRNDSPKCAEAVR